MYTYQESVQIIKSLGLLTTETLKTMNKNKLLNYAEILSKSNRKYRMTYERGYTKLELIETITSFYKYCEV